MASNRMPLHYSSYQLIHNVEDADWLLEEELEEELREEEQEIVKKMVVPEYDP